MQICDSKMRVRYVEDYYGDVLRQANLKWWRLIVCLPDGSNLYLHFWVLFFNNEFKHEGFLSNLHMLKPILQMMMHNSHQSQCFCFGNTTL